MRIYLGTIDLDPNITKDTIDIGPDDNPGNVYKAPELCTVYIKLTDVSGSIVSFRMTRNAYDLFRQKIIECKGYPK